MASCANIRPDEAARNESFLAVLPKIIAPVTDERNFVKKAVNCTLRQTRKRNLALHTAAVRTARLLVQSNAHSAR
jgi:3-methyladenine DNA glycosylase AlkD